MSVNINNTENMTAQEFYNTIMELQGEVENLRAQAKAKKEKGKGKSDISKEIGSIMSQIREWMELFRKYHWKEYYECLGDDEKGLKTRDEIIEDYRRDIEKIQNGIEISKREISKIEARILERKDKIRSKDDAIKRIKSGEDIWK